MFLEVTLITKIFLKKNGYNILPGDPGYPDDRLGFP